MLVYLDLLLTLFRLRSKQNDPTGLDLAVGRDKLLRPKHVDVFDD